MLFQDNIPENPASPEDRWRVSASWVLDLDQYNEWMSEEDYEVDEKGGKKVHKLRLSVEELMPIDSGEKRATKGAPGRIYFRYQIRFFKNDNLFSQQYMLRVGGTSGSTSAISSKQKRRRSPSPTPTKGSNKRKRYC